MAKACHCKKPAECEECPEWIFTFADLVMLMMGFFVILWVLKPPAGKQGSSDSKAEESKSQWIDTVGEIRSSFGYTPDPHSADPVDKHMLQKMRGTKEGGENDHPRESAPGMWHDTTSIRPGQHAVVGARLLFDQGSSDLLPETREVLNAIAENIRGHTNIILVKGHASRDDLPETSTAQARMNLSLRRAQAAADHLMNQGVSPETLRVQGCSTFEPVRQRAYSRAAQSDNRRVEIETTTELVSDREDPTLNPPGAHSEAAPEVGPSPPEVKSSPAPESPADTK